LLLTGNLSLSCVEIKETIFHLFRLNYNDIDVEITWRCQIDSFIQSGSNIMILYVSSRSKSVCVPTSIGPSNSVGRDKNSLSSNDLLQRINNTMFDNHFADQYKFKYSEPSNNEDDVYDEIIPPDPQFRDASGSSFSVSHD
jgi:hypothetical protein